MGREGCREKREREGVEGREGERGKREGNWLRQGSCVEREKQGKGLPM